MLSRQVGVCATLGPCRALLPLALPAQGPTAHTHSHQHAPGCSPAYRHHHHRHRAYRRSPVSLWATQARRARGPQLPHRAATALRPLRTMATAPAAPAAPAEMTDEERFLFDLNGFLVVRGVLAPPEVAALNAAVDAHKGEAQERQAAALKNAAGTALAAEGSRVDLGGMLGWEGAHGDAFRALLAHPRVAPYLVALLGEGYRLDHQPLVILQGSGSEGFSLHGGPLSAGGALNPVLQYRCHGGVMWNSLLAMSVALCDTAPGDGGFVAVRGSHKMNFRAPADFVGGASRAFAEHACQPATQAGDVILFSEATVHGAAPWRAAHERRLALYRFAPHNMAYGRAYTAGWGEGVLAQCTPVQRAVLAAPYAVRLDRETVTAEGSAGAAPRVYSRAPAKVEHDRRTFGTDYF